VNAPIPALTDRALLRDASYVDGDWLRPSGTSIAVTNPATGELLAQVSKAGREVRG
jgi:acyl-CoA reductase-like NAD-dependent aldehyde dehydrogenase